MPRTPQTAAKAPKRGRPEKIPRSGASEKLYAMTLPISVMADIDHIAEEERRSRQGQVAVFLEAAVRDWKQQRGQRVLA